MPSISQIIDYAFALSLSVGVGVIVMLAPLIDGTPYWNAPVLVGFVVSVAVAVVVATRENQPASRTIWKYSALAFVLFALLSFSLGSGATTGDDSSILNAVIWFVGVALSYGFYRYHQASRDPLSH